MSPATHRSRGRELLIHATLLALVLVALFPRTFFFGEVTVPGTLLYGIPPWEEQAPPDYTPTANLPTLESLTQFFPWYTLTQRALQNGDWPLWNPLEYAGTPLLANFQSAALYPIHLLHAFTDVCVAMTIYVLVKLWVCGMTAYLFGRYLRLSVPASRFLSFGWMLCGYTMVWTYWAEADVAGWLPLLFLGLQLLLDGKPRRGFATVTFSASLLLLAGHPETAFIMALGAGAYFVLYLLLDHRHGRALWTPLALSLAAWIVAILVSAAQILPFLEYLPNSHTLLFRPMETTRHCVPSYGFTAFWVPRFLGFTSDGTYWGDRNSNFVHILYSGVAVWIGLGLLFTRAGGGIQARKMVLPLVVPCLFLLLMAFDIPSLAPLRRIPILGSTWEIHYVSFSMFALPLLGALGIERWFSTPRKVKELAWTLPIAFLSLGVPLAVFWFVSGFLEMKGLSDYVVLQLLIAAAFLVCSIVVLGTFCFWRRPAILKTALVVVLVVDLLVASRGMRPTAPRRDAYPPTRLTQYLSQLEGPIRVSVESTTIATGMMAACGIEEVWGYDGIYPGRIMRFLNECNRRSWNVMEPVCGISHYLHPPGFLSPEDAKGRLERLTTLDGIEVYKNLRAFPRAFLVGQVKVVGDADALFDTICAPGYDPRRVAVTERPPRGPLPKTASTDLGAARVVERTSLRVKVYVEANEESVVVLTDGYFPGWEARVDGRPVELFPVYYAFRGAVVPQGKHAIEYLYRPWSFRVGLTISILAMLGSVVASGLFIPKAASRTS